MPTNNEYFYFAKHKNRTNVTPYLQAAVTYEGLTDTTKSVVDGIVEFYYETKEAVKNDENLAKRNLAHFNQVAKMYYNLHKPKLKEVLELTGLKEDAQDFLGYYLCYNQGWGSTAKGYGKNSSDRAKSVSESFLIREMINKNKSSIYPLYVATDFNKALTKPYLPAIIISLEVDHRERTVEAKHTGRFAFDFDKFDTEEEAKEALDKLWKGTPNLKPYIAYISPKGKGVKVFCKVDIDEPAFKHHFGETGETNLSDLTKYHKRWYEGARKEFAQYYPEYDSHFDTATIDPQRLTFIPFIENPLRNMYYNTDRISNYEVVSTAEKKAEESVVKEAIKKNYSLVKKEKLSNPNLTDEEAYRISQKKKADKEYNPDEEIDKLTKVVDLILELYNTDAEVTRFVNSRFNDYFTLYKLSAALFNYFGDPGNEQLERLIPAGSNKLSGGNDSRWKVISAKDGDTKSIGSFYKLVSEIPQVKAFLKENYYIKRSDKDFITGVFNAYESNNKQLEFEKEESDQTDRTEPLDLLTQNIMDKKVENELYSYTTEESLSYDIELGAKDYLDKEVLEDLFQNKYKKIKLFIFRSQCGTGKNSIVNLKHARLKGKIALGEPYSSIMNQASFDEWESAEDGTDSSKLFAGSSVEKTLRSFKKEDKESLRVNFEPTLRGVDVSNIETLNCTYNQLLHLSFETMATFDYIFIDECHVLSSDLGYRKDVIADLILHMINFVRKKTNAKTKIIFMTGTQSVETLVIEEQMKALGFGDLYKNIIVKKTYPTNPKVVLEHLDVESKEERMDAVIQKIGEYVDQGKKVAFSLNNKSQMNDIIREIHGKISPKIRVGTFYSGSTGACTQNIVGGRFGEFDVVLFTSYFVNGINITKDGITDEEYEAGKRSLQDYAVIIDLGYEQSALNVMCSIQAINRFRNRRVDTTIFLPKIFKRGKEGKFDFRNACRIVYGINKHNFDTLNREYVDLYEDERQRREYLEGLELLRRNPNLVTEEYLTETRRKQKERDDLFDIFVKYNSLYDDWFYSMEAFYRVCKDAGLSPTFRHYYKKNSLPEIEIVHDELEDQVIESYINNDQTLEYLSGQLEPDKRIDINSSGVITDPFDTSVSNLRVKNLLNGKYIITGDFHMSHETILKKLTTNHLNLSFIYGPDVATELLRILTHNEITWCPTEETTKQGRIQHYVNSCYKATPKKFSEAYTYLKALDMLSQRIDGVTKVENPTYISYVVNDPKISETLEKQFVDFMYDSTMWKLNNSDAKDKEKLKEFYNNREVMAEQDLHDLRKNLELLGSYKPLKIGKNGELKTPEQIHITRVLWNKNLLKTHPDFNVNQWVTPQKLNLSEYSLSATNFEATKMLRLNNLLNDIRKNLQDYRAIKELDELILKLNSKEPYFENLFKVWEGRFEVLLCNEEFKSLINYVYDVMNDNKQLVYDTFKMCEYTNYEEAKIHNRIPSFDKIFFTEEDFEIESLMPKEEIDVFTKTLIYHQVLKELGDKEVPRYAQNYWVALDSSNLPVVVKKTKDNFAKAITSYAYSDGNEDFMLKNGAPPKNIDRGIYNPNTFVRDYLINSWEDKVVTNYKFKQILIDPEDLKNFKNESI